MTFSIHLLWCIPLAAASALIALLYARKVPNHGRESLIDWLTRFGASFNGWINTVRQSNAKALAIIAIFLGTFLVWAIATLLELKVDAVIFPMWLAFVAGLGGFSLAQFKQERTTDYGYVERQNAAKPTTVVQANTAEVTGSPVKVEEKPQ